MKTALFGVLCLLCLNASLIAQDINSIGKEKLLSITGGASVNQIFYAVNGIQSRRAPYSYFTAGNVNVSLFGWSVPLSFGFSNQSTTFQQPFNRYSLHPTYKWMTGHFGYTTMTFSPYTVNGHVFLGGGVDLAPEGKWKFSGLYGRFLKPVQPNMEDAQLNTPVYQRMGYGFKAAYTTGRDFLELTLFHAQDAVNSIRRVPDSLNILPQENLVASIGAGKSFLNKFFFRTEWATSAISNDTRADETVISHPLAKTRFLYTPRQTSSFYNAMKASLDFQSKTFLLGIGYERIDPEYRTFGAYYFNNDLVNVTVNGSTSILHGRMNVAVSAGTQHDNVDKSKISTMSRAVGSLNINYAASQKLNVSISYSNFQTYTNIRSQFQRINQVTPYDNLDTLNFTQLSQNASVNAMYTFGKNTERKQSINFNLSIQDATDKQGEFVQNSGMRFYNGSTAYSFNITPKNLILSLSVNATFNEAETMSTRTYGPVASITKSFFDKKFRLTLSSTYNNTTSNGVRIAQVINGRLTGVVSIHKKHNVNLSSVVINRDSMAPSGKSYTEFTGTLGYAYNFGWTK